MRQIMYNHFFFYFAYYIEIREKKLILVNDGINKNAFHKHKQTIDINKVDINKIAISDEDSDGKKGSFKFFIGYKINEGIRPLCIKLQTNEWIC